jgi:KH domain
MASGMIVDFNIDPDLVGIAIGKKGARIKQVEKDSGVSSVNVDGKSGAPVLSMCAYVSCVDLPTCVECVCLSLSLLITVTASYEHCKTRYESSDFRIILTQHSHKRT